MRKLINKLVPRWIMNFGWSVLIFIAKKCYSLKFDNLILRKGTSDGKVFSCIFIMKENKIPVKINPKLIIDAGAYTGLTSLFYHLEYPKAKIIAIEPENSNFNILEKNTKKISKISRIKAGLWHKNAFLKIVDRKTGKWGFITEEVSKSQKYNIKAITVDSVLKKSGFNKIDILKIDIEGSEKELFSKNSKHWIGKTNIIVIELHDKIKKGCSKAFYSAIDRKKWNEYKDEEKVILVRKKFIK